MRNIFSEAQAMLAQGQAAQVIALLNNTPLPTAQHKLIAELIRASAAQQLKRLDTALVHLNNALKIDPLNPDANLNCIRLLRQQKRFEVALERLRALPAALAKHPQSVYLSGLTRFDLKQYDEALQQFNKLIETGFAKHDVCLMLSKCYRYLNKPDLALKSAQEAVALSGGSVTTLNEYGLVLKLRHDWSQAIQTFEAALQKDSNNAVIKKNLASCKAFAECTDEATALYQQVVETNELDLDAQHWLCALRWETGQNDYLKSYEQALLKYPQQPELRFEYAKKLSQVERVDEAQEVLANIRDIHKYPKAVGLFAQLTIELNDFDTPVERLSQCLKVYPDDIGVKFEFAKALLCQGNAKEALSIFDWLVKCFPEHQGYICFRNTALRQLNDERYHFYCNYDDHVLEAIIETPQGFSNLEEFNQCLANELKQLHTNKRAPLDQSLRNGTQTWENLFQYDVPVIQSLLTQLRKQTEIFLSDLRVDKTHPFLSRLSNRFCETDSWSVILNKSGFHVSHFHPAGWLSAPYYVQVPHAVDSGEQQGWLELGKPGINLSSPLEAERLIAPKPGKIVQFPSYMWHGTRAFNTNEQRITVAYDTLPMK